MVINSIVDSRSVHQPLPRAGNQPRAGAATVPRTRPCNPELSSPRRDRDPESLPSCVVIVLGPNPQNPAPPPMGGPPPSRGRRRRRHGSGASLVFWDGRRGVNRGSPGERGRCGAEGRLGPGSAEWPRSVQGAGAAAGAGESPGQVSSRKACIAQDRYLQDECLWPFSGAGGQNWGPVLLGTLRNAPR